MIGAAVAADGVACGAGELEHVLAGVVLDEPAARLAGLLDRDFLAEAGWDPTVWALSLPAEHSRLGRAVCRVGGCTATARGSHVGEVCWRCFTRLTKRGLSAEEIASSSELPPLPSCPAGCAVPGCQRMSPGGRSRQRTGLCQAHSRRFRRKPGMSMEKFLADPRVRPLPALGPCRVAACTRRAESEHGYCPTHYVRWRSAVTADPGVDQQHWRLTQPAVAEGGRISLRGLAPLVVAEVLYGMQQRTRGGAKTTDVNLRAVCDGLRRQQVATIAAVDVDRVPGRPARSLLRTMARHVRRALAEPGSEQIKDVWDLAMFGHPGRLSFTGIAQPWLRHAAKRWAAEELPRHRGGGASNLREKINALARLSEYLRSRHDGGQPPRRWADPTSRASSTGSLTSSRPGRSAVTAGTSFAGAPAPPWPGSAPSV